MQGTTNVQASAGAVAPETRQQRAPTVGTVATVAGNQTSGKLSQAQVRPETVTNTQQFGAVARMSCVS